MKNIFIPFIFFILALVAFLFSSCKKETEPIEVKVLSFNIWVGGGKSVGETASVITKTGADIVGIQESTSWDEKNIAKHIADSLGWNSYISNSSQTIITKYPIVDTSANKLGVKIQIDKTHSVWMFNSHLYYCPYQPYQLNSISYCDAPLFGTADEAIASAKASRGQQIDLLVDDVLLILKDSIPVFSVGDFNEPSHLDWTEKAATANLHKLAVAWPSTKTLVERTGLKDSYRTIYPDETKNLGYTWTPLPEKEAYTDVLDRIDFIFFGGSRITVAKSQVVGEESQSSDIGLANYPSDHRAVLSTFTIY